MTSLRRRHRMTTKAGGCCLYVLLLLKDFFFRSGSHADGRWSGAAIQRTLIDAKRPVRQDRPKQAQSVHDACDKELEPQLAIVMRDEPALHQQKHGHQRDTYQDRQSIRFAEKRPEANIQLLAEVMRHEKQHAAG